MSSKSFPPTTLAIDYGEKRIGLAVSFGTLAEPVGVITNDEAFLVNLKRVMDEYQVKQILVGVSEGQSAEKARGLGDKLAQLTRLPIYYVDETLSTKIAMKKLKQANKKVDQKNLDHFAAAEFLQEWLETT